MKNSINKTIFDAVNNSLIHSFLSISFSLFKYCKIDYSLSLLNFSLISLICLIKSIAASQLLNPMVFDVGKIVIK